MTLTQRFVIQNLRTKEYFHRAMLMPEAESYYFLFRENIKLSHEFETYENALRYLNAEPFPVAHYTILPILVKE